MAREIVWTLDGPDDIDFAEYIARDSPFHSGEFVQAVFAAAESLQEFAERGHIVTELEDENVRELIVGSYRLAFRVQPTSVTLLRLIHGAHDFRRAWRSG